MSCKHGSYILNLYYCFVYNNLSILNVCSIESNFENYQGKLPGTTVLQYTILRQAKRDNIDRVIATPIMISVADRDFDDGLGCLSVHHDVLTFSAHSVASMSADDAATIDGGCRMHQKNPTLF